MECQASVPHGFRQPPPPRRKIAAPAIDNTPLSPLYCPSNTDEGDALLMADEREVLQNHNELRSRAVDCIHKLADVARQRHAIFTLNGMSMPRSTHLLDSASHLEKNEFTLAVVGEFSRGKSTLINVLLESHDLLPTSIKPTTAAITILRYGPIPKATVNFYSGEKTENISLEQLSEYVVADGLDGEPLRNRLTRKFAQLQAENKVDDLSYDDIDKEVKAHLESSQGVDGIREVDMWFPSPFLEDGIILVDTPGIGSVNPQHGEATRGFIHKADAVIFLVNTDPVISASECNFLTFLKDYVNRFLFVVTKIDRYTDDEREESINYTRDTIVQHAGIPDPPIFPVSAKLATDGRKNNDGDMLRASGFPSFVKALNVFLIRERGQAFVRDHVMAAMGHLSDIRNSVQMELHSIQLSLGELQQKLDGTRPELEKARRTKNRIMSYIVDQERDIRELVLGSGNIDWMRISYVLREGIYEQIDGWDWDHLKQAADLVPISVRDFMSDRLQSKLDEISQRMTDVRNKVVGDSNLMVQEMNQSIGTQFIGLRIPSELDLHFEYDPRAFLADLKKVSTITVGSTLALTLGSVLLFGPAGAAVMLGGLLAGTGVHSVFRNRVKNELKEQLRQPLSDVVDTILNNINNEVITHLTDFRVRMDETLSNTIASVEDTLTSLEGQMSSAEFNTSDRLESLTQQKDVLDEVDTELSLIVGPGW